MYSYTTYSHGISRVVDVVAWNLEDFGGILVTAAFVGGGATLLFSFPVAMETVFLSLGGLGKVCL